jgi:transaldolase
MMPIFLDTGNLDEIERFLRMGVVRGVTTNPTILLRDGVTGGFRGIEERARAIAKLIAPLPLSLEVTTADPAKIREQAVAIASWADNIVVKVTVHGPDGELEPMEIVHELESRHGVRVNVTAMMSAQQLLLAAMAGATYVSIFAGRVSNMGYDTREEIRKSRVLIDRFRLKAQIIAGSTREVVNVVEWLDAGAHVVTVLPEFLRGMLVHPYSRDTVQQFLRDAAKLDTP